MVSVLAVVVVAKGLCSFEHSGASFSVGGAAPGASLLRW